MGWKGLAVSLGIHAAILTAAAWVTWGGMGDAGADAESAAGAEDQEEVLLPVMMPPPKPQAMHPEARPTVPVPRHSFPPLVFQRRLVVEHEAAITLPEPEEQREIMLPPALAARVESQPSPDETPPTSPATKTRKQSAKKAAGKGGGTTSGSARLESRSARVVASPAPVYPTTAKRAKAEGSATIRVSLNASGAILNCEVSHSTGRDDLDEAALKAVKRWRFSPATRGSETIATSVLVKVVFQLT
ncbi:MAG: energy transducer TonB [Verrucomicrobiaceae bacterium]|nr:energy transducer TonB [Verrucomicrobiaceae bacterium]